jgi:hypothetical protein
MGRRIVIIVVVLAILLAVAAGRLAKRRAEIDGPARVVNWAADRLPPHLHGWGQAMVAELAQIESNGPRWRFALGVLRVALVPPVRHRGRVLIVAVGGLVAAAGATTFAAIAVPTLAVFIGALSISLFGYATVAASRSDRPGRSRVVVGLVAIGAIAGAVAAVTGIARAYPDATVDGTHVFSVAFAVILTVYLALTLAQAGPGKHTTTILRWALGGALVSGVIWTVVAFVQPLTGVGVLGLVSPVGAAATLAVSLGASTFARSRTAGIRAGVLCAMLGALVLFTVNLTSLLHVREFTLTDPYDIAAFPQSGAPDVATYLLSDAIGGEIISGLVLYPAVLFAVALIGAAAGAGVAGRRGLRQNA